MNNSQEIMESTKSALLDAIEDYVGDRFDDLTAFNAKVQEKLDELSSILPDAMLVFAMLRVAKQSAKAQLDGTKISNLCLECIDETDFIDWCGVCLSGKFKDEYKEAIADLYTS